MLLLTLKTVENTPKKHSFSFSSLFTQKKLGLFQTLVEAWLMIQPAMNDTDVIKKTKELCETILEQPNFSSLKQDIKAFMSDEKSQEQYQAVSEKGRVLHQKQHNGDRPTEEEISSFEKMKFDLMENQTAKAFIDAHAEMNRVQDKVNQYLNKAFELGRVPCEEDFKEEQGSCGSGCGCH